MKRLLAVVVGVAVCGLTTLLGLTLATAAGPVSTSGNYDVPPAQAATYISTVTRKLGWAERRPGTYAAALLPWSSATINVSVTRQDTGTHVTIGGHPKFVGELKRDLDQRLPALAPH